ncbi:MAG: hypothetical protein GY861_13345 [bacterium]|nr:hypothetical protein [bacterium]
MIEKKFINKTMELSDLKSDRARKIITELNDLIKSLKDKELKISSWFGKFSSQRVPMTTHLEHCFKRSSRTMLFLHCSAQQSTVLPLLGGFL